jgi:hypothetical protein
METTLEPIGPTIARYMHQLGKEINYMAQQTSEAALFYDHKRQAHGGAWQKDCAECERLWQAHLAASKAKS